MRTIAVVAVRFSMKNGQLDYYAKVSIRHTCFKYQRRKRYFGQKYRMLF